MKGNQTDNATRQMAREKQEETVVRGASQSLKASLWRFLLHLLLLLLSSPFQAKEEEGKMGRGVEFGPCQTGNSSE